MIKTVARWLTICCLLAVLLLPTVGGGSAYAVDDWYDQSWGYRMKITFGNSASSENLTDFPVLVYLDTGNFTFAHAKSAGEDIRFTDSNGTALLKYEIERWVADTEAWIWVKVPQVDDSDTDYIYVYYGNSGASDAQDAENVWNTNYRLVSHLKDITSSTVNDSTSNANNGTKTGADSPVEATGKIGKGQTTNGANKIDFGTDSSLRFGGTAFTVQCWIYAVAQTTAYLTQRTDVENNWQAYLQTTDTKLYFSFCSSDVLKESLSTASGYTASTWTLVTVTYDGSNVKFYKNGSQAGSSIAQTGSMDSGVCNTYLAFNGYGYATGTFDEARISSATRSASWIYADYLTQTDALNTYASEETSIGPPAVTTMAATDLAPTSCTLNGYLDATGQASGDVTLSFQYGLTTDYGSTAAAGTLDAPGSFDAGISGLDEDTLYHFRAKAVGTNGTGYGEDMVVTATTDLFPIGTGDETNIQGQTPSSTSHWDKVDEVSADGTTTTVNQQAASFARDFYKMGDIAQAGLWEDDGTYIEVASLASDGSYIYLASSSTTHTDPGKVFKINPATMETIATWTGAAGECYPYRIIYDGNYLYASMRVNPGKVVKINPSNMTTVATWTGAGGEDFAKGLCFDDTGFIYVALDGSCQVAKITASNMTTAGIWSGPDPWDTAQDVVFDGTYIYTGCGQGAYPPHPVLVKINRTTMETVAATWTTIDNWGNMCFYDGYIYHGTFSESHYEPAYVEKVDPSTMTTVGLWQGVQGQDHIQHLAGLGDQLYITTHNDPGLVIVIDVNSMETQYVWSNAPGQIGGSGSVFQGTYFYTTPYAMDTDGWVIQRDLPELGTIYSVTVWAEAKMVAGTGNVRTALKTGGIAYNGSEKSLTTSFASYSTVYEDNPQTGNEWTWEEIALTQIGVSLKGDGTNNALCTQVKLQINYARGAPSISTSEATNVTETSATINGYITATGGEDPTVEFFWGTTDGGDNPALWTYDSVPTSPSQPQGEGAFYKNLTGLTDETEYFFTARATNSVGARWGNTQSFTTGGAPVVVTGSAADVTISTATLQGTLTNLAGYSPVYVYFEWGLTTAYGNTTPDQMKTSTGSFNQVISGLLGGTLYHFRAVVRYGADSYAYGNDTSFTTSTFGAPTVTTGTAVSVTTSTATLQGTLTNIGDYSSVTVYFRYGLTTSYGTGTIEQTRTSTGSFSQVITGLSSGVTYHYQAVARYAGASYAYGSDATFTTETTYVPPPAPEVYALQEYLNTGGDGDSDAIYGDNYYAMQFTSGNLSHTVTLIKMRLKRVGNPGAVTVSFQGASGGLPTGSALVSAIYNGNNFSTSYAWYEFTVGETGMERNTQYSIVVSAPSGDASNYVYWQVDSGGGLANAVASASTDAGSSWASETPKDCLFEIWGSAVLAIITVAQFDGYQVEGDMLFVAEVVNTYPPYNTTGTASQYFNVQLLDTGGSNVLAATTLKAWGNKPVGVYVGTDLAATLTKGSTYYIRVIGTFTGTPSVSYRMQAADWKGSNLRYLDDWCIDTARSMEGYYSPDVPYTAYAPGYGEVLSADAGVMFDVGIPNLSTVRPDLFLVRIVPIEIEDDTADPAYYEATGWTNQIGPVITADADTFADLFGLSSGETFLGLAFGVALLLLMFLGVALGGSGIICLLLACPVLFYANHLRVIDISMTMAIGVLLALVFAWKFWWSRV